MPSSASHTSAAVRTSTRKRKRSSRLKDPNNAELVLSTDGEDSQDNAHGHSEGEDDDDDDDGEATEPEPEHISTSSPAAVLAAAASFSQRQKFDERWKVTSSTAEEVLERQRATWKSAVYGHFHEPTIRVDLDGVVKYIFRCKRTPSIEVARVRHDESTSNLNRHVQRCTPPADPKQVKAMLKYAHGITYDPTEHRIKAVLWVVRTRRSYAILEDKELREIFHMLYPQCIDISRHTISRDVIEIHAMSQVFIADMLKKYPGRLHIAADGWTSPNVISFIGVTVHFLKGQKLTSLILDFVKLTKAHTGVYLASKIAELLRDWGIDKKIMALTSDNASNNDTLVTELATLLPSFRGPSFHVRCFAHVLNLIAGAAMSPFARAAPTGDDDDDDELPDLVDDDGEGDEDYDAPSDDEVADEVHQSDELALGDIITVAQLDERLRPLSKEHGMEARLAITKLRQLAIKIAHSPTVSQDLVDCCQATGTPIKKMVRDVATRWNSTAETVQRSLDLRDALDRLVLLPELNKPRGVRLQRFRLSSAEWKILAQLSPLLDMITFATKEVSQSTVPLLHSIIPIIDSLTSFFDSAIDDEESHPAVRHAALRAMKMLNKYYARTDDCIAYTIAMMFHPKYKAVYFRTAGWPEEWITTALKNIESEWIAHYKGDAPTTSASASASASASSRESEDRFAQARRHFASLNTGPTLTGDALRDYLAAPPEPGVTDALTYWLNARSQGNALAQMALDYLTIPATSTDVERAFSRGGLTVSKLRHSLSDKSTRSSSVLGSWAEDPDLIPLDAIIERFREKSRRNKKKAKLTVTATEVVVVD